MIEMVFVMMMIQNESVIEYVPFPGGMSDCLSQKEWYQDQLAKSKMELELSVKTWR